MAGVALDQGTDGEREERDVRRVGRPHPDPGQVESPRALDQVHEMSRVSAVPRERAGTVDVTGVRLHLLERLPVGSCQTGAPDE